MRERYGKSGISRLGRSSHMARNASNLKIIRACEAENSRNKSYHQKKCEQLEEKIKYFDERYAFIVNAFMNELSKRNISINNPEISDRIDEILSAICGGSFYQARFAKDDIRDVKNAVLRKINAEKQKTAGEER